jgi:transcriptional regulator with XRE-family HTH domain
VVASGREQQAVAEAVGVSDGQFSRWVNDKGLPSGSALVQLPVELGCDGHWLLTGEGDMVRPEAGEAEWRIQRVRAALDAPYVSQSVAGATDPELAAADALTEEDRSGSQDVAG